MLLMNIFLCTAMSCSCANTEVTVESPSQKFSLSCLYQLVSCRSLRRSPRSLRNTILIAAGMAVSMAPGTRCMAEMRTRAILAVARRYTQIGLIDIKLIYKRHAHTHTDTQTQSSILHLICICSALQYFFW